MAVVNVRAQIFFLMKRSLSVQVLTNESGCSSKTSLPVPADELNLDENSGFACRVVAPAGVASVLLHHSPCPSHLLQLLLFLFKGFF